MRSMVEGVSDTATPDALHAYCGETVRAQGSSTGCAAAARIMAPTRLG
jgi:hypothetical protein